jgi:hypothetical protein
MRRGESRAIVPEGGVMPAPLDPRPNRPVRSLMLFALFALVATVALWAASTAVLDGAGGALDWLRAHDDPTGRATATTILATATLLNLVLVWWRASSPRRAVRLGRGGSTIAVDELAEWLRQALVGREDVADATVRVENLHRRGLRVAVVLEVTAEARLEQTGDAAATLVEHLLGERVGLPLDEPPQVELRYRELNLRSRGAHA